MFKSLQQFEMPVQKSMETYRMHFVHWFFKQWRVSSIIWWGDHLSNSRYSKQPEVCVPKQRTYTQVTLKAPVPARSLKLSNDKAVQYLDKWPIKQQQWL